MQRFLCANHGVTFLHTYKQPQNHYNPHRLSSSAIPSVWTQEELKQLVGAIDLGSPKGKRDYAIILIACRLGLRCTDIKNLCFENFKWAEKKLCFTQSKTGQPLELPLTADVGWAVIDYLKYGRPKVDSSCIFVRHVAPFLPFAGGDYPARAGETVDSSHHHG